MKIFICNVCKNFGKIRIEKRWAQLPTVNAQPFRLFDTA